MTKKIGFILLPLLIIFSCKPVKYTYTNKDGKTFEYNSFFMAGDKKDKKNKTSMTLSNFKSRDINKYYDNVDSMEIQELNITDLKTKFVDYDYTFISVWHPCNSSMVYEIKQYIELVDTLSSVTYDSQKMAFVFAGLSYDFHFYNLFMKSFNYHLQSYVIPSSYHEKVLMKKFVFMKELNPKYTDEYNDDISFFSVLVLDNKGEVIKMIDYKYTEKGYKVMKDYEAVRDELLELVR